MTGFYRSEAWILLQADTMARRLLKLAVLAAASVPLAAYVGPIKITARGVIELLGGAVDDAGLFGPSGGSLIGLRYELSINTDPLLNPLVLCATFSCNGTLGGTAYPGTSPGNPLSPGAPFTITMRVGGVSFTQTELNPFRNESARSDALTVNDISTTLQDSVFQLVSSAGCVHTVLACMNAYILAYSLTTPFVSSLGLTERLNVSHGLDPGSNAYFSFRNIDGVSTI